MPTDRDQVHMTRGGVAAPADVLRDYYRAGPGLPRFDVSHAADGPFRFGPDAIYFDGDPGSSSRIGDAPMEDGSLPDLKPRVDVANGVLSLPFDPVNAVQNLLYERYVEQTSSGGLLENNAVRSAYYALRPLLPVGVRRQFQRLYLMTRHHAPVPRWPLDRSVDRMCERLMALALDVAGVDHIPFIWFWPRGASAAAMVTHDVETRVGRDRSEHLIRIDAEFDIRGAFQVVPERRYEVSDEYLGMIRGHGCEVNVHGLDHVGNLFQNRAAFLRAAQSINRYAESFGARGFRSPALYRNADWLHELAFDYDMSVPNVARFEAQSGGCCTVMPYFLPGGMLELPLTTSEDYTLFHILNDYSVELWQEQIEGILNGHGLISILVHPDYVMSDKALATYRRLLERLSRLGQDKGLWIAQPGEIAAWWRARDAMTLVRTREGDWQIEGEGSERARIAWAVRDGDGLRYELEAPVRETA